MLTLNPNLTTEKYIDTLDVLPQSGQHIQAHQQGDYMVVYQAYKPAIAAFAVKNQYLGGNHFSYSRMSWIKPNFLWMMFRCGWASKDNQENVLAIWLEKKDFDSILQQAVISSFNRDFYNTQEEWQADLDNKEVRLQWDPDHDPHGRKLTRRAMQIGMKGDVLEAFGKSYVRHIEDITSFVKEQKTYVEKQRLENLSVPVERVYRPLDIELCKKIGID